MVTVEKVEVEGTGTWWRQAKDMTMQATLKKEKGRQTGRQEDRQNWAGEAWWVGAGKEGEKGRSQPLLHTCMASCLPSPFPLLFPFCPHTCHLSYLPIFSPHTSCPASCLYTILSLSPARRGGAFCCPEKYSPGGGGEHDTVTSGFCRLRTSSIMGRISEQKAVVAVVIKTSLPTSEYFLMGMPTYSRTARPSSC